MRPTPELLAALDYLHNTHEMRVIREWYNEHAREQMAKAIKTDEHADVARGRAREAAEFADLLNTAPQLRDRLEKRNGTSKQGATRHPNRSH